MDAAVNLAEGEEPRAHIIHHSEYSAVRNY